MTEKCNGKLRIYMILFAATLGLSGCSSEFLHDEVDVDSANADWTRQSTESRSLIIDWSAPSEYDDGSPLMDLSGYRFYYGRSSGVYYNRIEINQAGISSYIIDVGQPGTYYIAMSSVNSTGVESVLSAEVSRTVL